MKDRVVASSLCGDEMHSVVKNNAQDDMTLVVDRLPLLYCK